MSTGVGRTVLGCDRALTLAEIERDLAPVRQRLERALAEAKEELRAATLLDDDRAWRLQAQLSAQVAEATRFHRDEAERQAQVANAIAGHPEEGERAARLARAVAATEAARAEELAQATARMEREQRAREFGAVDPNAPLMVPVLGFRQELALRGLVLFGLATMAWFWMWWLGEGRGAWSAPSVLVTLLFGWVSLLTLYFFFFAARMTRPNPALPVPRMRVAIVVTKAPSEPWSVVEKTLEAMLAQDFPYAYDVWLADERPSEETLRWCLAKRVGVSTRFGVTEYHQPNWPRRTKCKEGNLAWFYDCVGYDRYDVVAQLDADHVPAPDYLAAMVRPFRDE
ncbi:MAG TPA: hypothetical protein VNB24_09700, partial [Acidimicrobiales bacterium]|nr:hypothetical protein [Acidimicrobiales bacterium]